MSEVIRESMKTIINVPDGLVTGEEMLGDQKWKKLEVDFGALVSWNNN